MGKWREWLNNNSAVVTVVAVVILIISLAVIIWYNQRGPSQPGQIAVYYYDLSAGKLITAKQNDIPPIDIKSGAGMGVKAYVYSCGECSDASKRFVGYLEKLTDEAKKARLEQIANPNAASGARRRDLTNAGTMIRREKEGEWVAIDSDEGRAILNELREKCATGETLRQCLP
jgi:hypothetical protein